MTNAWNATTQPAAVTTTYPSYPSGAPIRDQNVLSAARTAAENATAFADSRGWDIPKRWPIVQAQYFAAMRLAETPIPPFPGLPSTAAGLAKMISSYAATVAVHEMGQRVARETVDECATEMINLHRGALAGWIDSLIEQFDQSVAEFLHDVHTAPTMRVVTGHESDQVMDAMRKQVRIVNTLDQLHAQRVSMGIAVGEPDAHQGTLWLVIDPPEASDENLDAGRAAQLVAIQREFNSRGFSDQEPIARWRYLAGVGQLSMPRFGEINARVVKYDRLRGLFGGAPQMTALGHQNRRDEQDRQRQDYLRAKAKAQADRDAATEIVYRQRAIEANAARR